MWFKNLVLYTFDQLPELDSQTLEDQLQAHPFTPCGKTQMSCYGWVSPVPGGEAMVHTSGEFITLMARKEEKILPASVVREFVNDQVEQIEEEQGRKVFRKEKERIKEDVLQNLMPRAFTRSQFTRAYIDTRTGVILIDASSFKRAEELTSFLRRTLGTLPIRLPNPNSTPGIVMTHWLNQPTDIPTSFTLNDECELTEPGSEGSQIRCKRQDLTSEEVSKHLASGKQVSKLSIEWAETLSCVLSDDLIIRRIKFTDSFQEKAEIENHEDIATQFDNDFALMAKTLQQFINRLFNVWDVPSVPDKREVKHPNSIPQPALA